MLLPIQNTGVLRDPNHEGMSSTARKADLQPGDHALDHLADFFHGVRRKTLHFTAAEQAQPLGP